MIPPIDGLAAKRQQEDGDYRHDGNKYSNGNDGLLVYLVRIQAVVKYQECILDECVAGSEDYTSNSHVLILLLVQVTKTQG